MACSKESKEELFWGRFHLQVMRGGLHLIAERVLGNPEVALQPQAQSCSVTSITHSAGVRPVHTVIFVIEGGQGLPGEPNQAEGAPPNSPRTAARVGVGIGAEGPT